MPGNKGFKGIDKRDYVAPSYSDRASGMQGVHGHSMRRIDNHDGAASPNFTSYQLKAEDWQRLGVSASFSPESGSKLFHSPDTNFGASWSERPVWSNCTVKVKGFTDRNEYSSVSFRMGNCANGNSNGSWYGMGGMGAWSQMHRSLLGAASPDDYTPSSATWPTTYSPSISMWASANNQLAWRINGQSQGTMNPCNQGDLIEIKFLHGGVIQLWQNDELFVTSLYNVGMDVAQPDDPHYMFHVQSNQEGAAGNFMVYDVRMNGEVRNHTAEGGICHNRYGTQLNQTMLPISTSFDSGSYSGALPTAVTSPDSGSCVVFDNGAYTTPIWSSQFITGSGKGGIYTMTYPSASCNYGEIGEIVGLVDHTADSGYNYYTQICTVRTAALTWGADTPGTNQYIHAWYSWNAAGSSNGTTVRTGGGNRQPVTSGSMFAFIVTGSEDLKITGGTAFDTSANVDGAQISALLLKMVDTTGAPINDYVSGNWMTITQSPYSKAGTGKSPKKLVFNDGTVGDHYCDIRIGEQWFASGSV